MAPSGGTAEIYRRRDPVQKKSEVCLGQALDWDIGTQVALLFVSRQPGSKQVHSLRVARSPRTRYHVTMG